MKDMTRATFLKLTGAAIALTVLISVVMVNINWMGMDGSVESGIYSTIVLNDIEAEASNQMEVDVTAQQYAWRFDYPEQGVSSTELHVPSGTQLELHLNALDVVHSFWVPEWGIKRDLVPGSDLPGGDEIDNTVRVTPDVEGNYQVVCTELCGWGHATMRAAAVVESQQQFDDWVKTQPKISKDNVGAGAAGGNGAGVYDNQVTE
jgi:heme/copper-type cytochrome/quinol oxidase subunit 2